MNLDKLFALVIAVAFAFATAGQLDVLQNWIWRAQAKLIYESRTETWGSPRFFPIKDKQRAEPSTKSN